MRLSKIFFKVVRKKGKKIHSRHFSLIFLKNRTKHSCFAVVVSKKINKLATKRNKIRRTFYSYIQTNINKIPTGFNFIIFLRAPVNQQNINQITNYLLQLFPNVDKKNYFKNY